VTRPTAAGAVLWLALLAVSCGGGDPAGGGNGDVTVQVADDVFTPDSVAVATGGTVEWQWVGANPHNVIFEDGVDNSGIQAAGTHTRTFPAAGTFRYRCTLHSVGFLDPTGMVGKVVAQ
jgi:plastocyanin